MAENGEQHKISCAMDPIIDAQMKGEITEENGLYFVENINVAAIETTRGWGVGPWSGPWLSRIKVRTYMSCPIWKQQERKHGVVVNAWWLANNASEFRPDRFLEEDGGTQAVVGDKNGEFTLLAVRCGAAELPGDHSGTAVPRPCDRKPGVEFRNAPGVEKIGVREEPKEGSSVCLQTNWCSIVVKKWYNCDSLSWLV
ncbi:cinnamate-4-hydroxylase [Actinidia rufa]|uniref:Cinnamate-4-hydroxylase n=1 Tax=Actinidia rufa TaxID=165716 RepID=A0A7J0DVS6_9ERIC|nr:cinnamate-4-hydroxylase [Actinidia rufa]